MKTSPRTGGAIRQIGGDLFLTNVSFHHNGYSSTGSPITTGGGALSRDGGNATLTNVTMDENWASYGGGMDHDNGNTTLTVKNIIVANSVGDNCTTSIAGSIFSLSTDATCGFGSGRNSVDVRLAPLADIGGFTSTHLPLADSPAIDAGTGAGCPASDQRGVPRPQGAACDVGAVEYRKGDTLPWLFIPLVVKAD